MPNNDSNYAATFYSYTYHYWPSLWLMILASVLFFLATIASFTSTALLRRQPYRKGVKFMYIIPAMGLVEVIGYVCRIATVELATNKLNAYIVGTLAILAAPIALALVNYIAVARVLQYVGRSVRVLGLDIKAGTIAKLFFGSDLTCFVVQMTGGSLLAFQKQELTDAGTAIMQAGLIIQLVFFSGFVYILSVITFDSSYVVRHIPSLKNFLVGEWITATLLYIRNVYRIVEWSRVEVLELEWAFYIFETLVIFSAFVFYVIFNFGRYLTNIAPPAEAGSEMAAGPGPSSSMEQSRPLWQVEFDAIKNQYLPTGTDTKVDKKSSDPSNDDDTPTDV